MKISSITFSHSTYHNKNIAKKNISASNEIKQKTFGKLPTTNHYLSFCAGKSLNLKQTFNELLTKEEQYPNDIYSMVQEELANGNPENKTLYDIHFDKYQGVLDCYSLEDLKKEFPEFKNVISAHDTEAKDNSFIGKFQNDELNIFDNSEDLTLQLIKLYWGRGFSLSDLYNYTENTSENKKGTTLSYTLSKLNIPLMNRHYASVLKLSNKEYNEKLTNEMSIKIKEAKEAREQKEDGEPVVIVRGPLSEAHRKHISEGLIKHFQEHPEKIYELSKRQKRFYEENPKYKEQAQEATDYAWNRTREGKSLSKHISKFAKKYNTQITNEELTFKKPMDENQQTMLSAFWQKNPWAKEQWSKAMIAGWAWAKEDILELMDGKTIPNEKISFNVIPTNIRHDINVWARKNGLIRQDEEVAFGRAVIHKDPNVLQTRKCREWSEKHAKITDSFFDMNNDKDNQIATAMQFAIIKFVIDLENNSKRLPESLREDINARALFYQVCTDYNGKNILFESKAGYSKMPIFGVDVHDISSIYTDIMARAFFFGHEELAEYMNKNLDKMHSEITQKTSDVLEIFR